MSNDDRTTCGLKGRIWAVSNGFTKQHMCEAFQNSIEHLYSYWVPRKSVDVIDLKQPYNLIKGVLS